MNVNFILYVAAKNNKYCTASLLLSLIPANNHEGLDKQRKIKHILAPHVWQGDKKILSLPRLCSHCLSYAKEK